MNEPKKPVKVHGAYTQLMRSAGHARRHVRGVKGNIDALNAALPLPEDPPFSRRLYDLVEECRDAEARLAALMDRTFDEAKKYLESNRERMTRDATLTATGRSIVIRAKE